jgi:peroxiredoxin
MLSAKLKLAKSLKAGNKFPNISLPDTAGKRVNISDYHENMSW